MKRKNDALKAGRPRVAQKWATKMVHSLYLSFEEDRDLHTLLYTCGVDSLDTIKQALREYITNHDHQSGDPAFQAEIAAKALGISIGAPKALAITKPASDVSPVSPPVQSRSNEGQSVEPELVPVTARAETSNIPAAAQGHADSADSGNDNLASRWLSE